MNERERNWWRTPKWYKPHNYLVGRHPADASPLSHPEIWWGLWIPSPTECKRIEEITNGPPTKSVRKRLPERP